MITIKILMVLKIINYEINEIVNDEINHNLVARQYIKGG